MKRFIITSMMLLTMLIPAWSQEDSFFDTGDMFNDDSVSSVELGGTLNSGISMNATADGFYAMFDDDAVDDVLTETASVELIGTYAGPETDLNIEISLDQDDISINEAYGTYYGNYLTMSAGISKVVWGKADEYHVIDALNSLDLSEFLQTNYLSMVIGKPMLKFDVPLTESCLLEAAWLPVFEGNTYATEGIWAPAEMKEARKAVESAVSYQAVQTYETAYQTQYDLYLDTVYNEAYEQYLAAYLAGGMPQATAETTAAASAETEKNNAVADAEISAQAAASASQLVYVSENQNVDAFMPQMDVLDSSQFGVHLTGTVGGFDYGFMYYWGYNKNPTVIFETTMIADTDFISDVTISYDRLQVVGTEAAFILAGFNIKGEAAYYLTEDRDGTDETIHNNSIKWVGGFDRDIPLSNLNINIQETGTYILGTDNITDANDIEYGTDVTENILIASLSDNYSHETIDVRVTGMYHFEGKDALIIPEIGYKFDDNFETSLSGRFFIGEKDSLFGQYNDNDEIVLSASYSF